MSTLVPRAVKDVSVRNKLVYEANENAPSRVCETLSMDDPEQIPGGFIDALGNSVRGLEMIVALPTAAMRAPPMNALAASICVHLSFDDRSNVLSEEFKGQWRAFWHSANQLQFLPRFSMASRAGVAGGDLDRLWAAHEVLAAQPSDDDLASEHWSEVFELSGLGRDQLRELASLNLPLPEVGVDLRNEEGAVAVGGEVVELCWAMERVAVISGGDIDLPGWRFVQTGEDLVSKLKGLIDDGVFG